MSNDPFASQVNVSDDSSAPFFIRWRGRQEGPYTAAVIETKLAANQIGLLHEISHKGQWVTLRAYFAEREAVLRAERQAREEQEQRARAEAERQAKEREERRRAESSEREQQKETATPVLQITSPTNRLLAFRKLLMRGFFVLSLLAFFLPNVSISFPILGRLDVSMFDFLSPRPDGKRTQATPHSAKLSKPTVQDFGDIRLEKATVGGVLCALSVMALIGHYLLTVVWGTVEFGFRKSVSPLTTIWLFLALQFPILFSIGVHMTSNDINNEVATGAASDDSSGFASVLGAAFVNNTVIAPGLVMWALMLIGLSAVGVHFFQKTVNQESQASDYGSIPHQS